MLPIRTHARYRGERPAITTQGVASDCQERPGEQPPEARIQFRKLFPGMRNIFR